MLFTEAQYADDYQETTKSQKEMLKRLVEIARKGNFSLPKIKKPRTKGEYAIAINRCLNALNQQNALPDDIKLFYKNRARFFTSTTTESHLVGRGYVPEIYQERENERYGIINPSPWTIAIREAQKKA